MNKTVLTICQKLSLCESEASMILEKAIIGGETTEIDSISWLNNRFLPNIISIDEDGYARMCIDALKILGSTAPTDYGSSRQRDMGQLWADMTRGYLGEYAFLKFLDQKWNLKAELGHDAGEMKDYLPMDIHKIMERTDEYRQPKIKISVKTTKWNGIWLDIPGDQFNHSDAHVLVKIGAGRDHLFAFFKSISVFKDKVLRKGEALGAISSAESSSIFDKLPSFKPIPAYICGFALGGESYPSLSYSGKKGKKNFTIKSWRGPINPNDLETIKIKEQISGKVSFEGIGEFAHDKGYLFNTGSLLCGNNDWDNLISRI